MGCADEASPDAVADPGPPASAPPAPGSAPPAGPDTAAPPAPASGPDVAPPATGDSACASGRARSISQFGITWTFSEERECGTYVNGDYWVLGPITLTAIAPAPSDGRHGTVINPKVGSDQGFDKDLKSGIYENKYVPALNVGKTLPLVVAKDSSVVSSITADAWTEFHTIQSIAILTVVAEKPQAYSFRPPYVGDGSRKSAFRYADVNHGKLGRLSRATVAAQLPSLAEATAMFTRPWYEQNITWTGRYMHLTYQAGPGGSGYGRNLALRTGDAALLLNLDFTSDDERDLLIGFVQYGLDIAGIVQNGGEWFADGGHNPGRLAPAMVAAHVLGDAGLAAMVKGSAMKFQEFQQTFSVSQADVNITNRQATNGGNIEGYTAAEHWDARVGHPAPVRAATRQQTHERKNRRGIPRRGWQHVHRRGHGRQGHGGSGAHRLGALVWLRRPSSGLRARSEGQRLQLQPHAGVPPGLLGRVPLTSTPSALAPGRVELVAPEPGAARQDLGGNTSVNDRGPWAYSTVFLPWAPAL